MHKIVNGEVIELSKAEQDAIAASWQAAESERLEDKKSEIRSMRNARLTSCDWTQLQDSSVNKTAWATYRQALRDVPAQSGFPENVVWPQPPA